MIPVHPTLRNMYMYVPTLPYFPTIFGLGLASPNAIVVIPKINSCQNHLQKKTSKSAKYRLPLRYKKRPVKITMHLGLDNIIKLKFPKNFDRCVILNVLNCLTKNFLTFMSLFITKISTQTYINILSVICIRFYGVVDPTLAY